jgi:putative ATP-dependent endonuclease of the OLD family
LSISPVVGTEFDISKSLESEFSVIINDARCPDIKQDFNHHGHGVIRQAMFNFLGIVKNNLPTNEHSSKKFIILFEEPEVYLHPKAIRLLRNVLYNLCEQSPFQLVCASHSPGLIDISKPHTSLVRLVRSSNAETYLYQAGDDLFASDEEQKQKVQMINRFDPNVCESFFADEIIMVEGDTEAVICREILSNSFPTKDIYVLNTGSKNNIPFFQKIFTHFRIKHHIIHDSDTRFIYKQSIDENGQLKYTPILKKDDTQRRNSAWIINSEIWALIETANAINPNLCRRFVSIYNFEYSNEYIYNSEKGKPLSAFEFANNHANISETNIYKFLSCIAGATESNCTFSSEELDVLVIEPNISRIAVEPTLLEEIAKVVTKTTPNTSDFVIKEA